MNTATLVLASLGMSVAAVGSFIVLRALPGHTRLLMLQFLLGAGFAMGFTIIIVTLNHHH